MGKNLFSALQTYIVILICFKWQLHPTYPKIRSAVRANRRSDATLHFAEKYLPDVRDVICSIDAWAWVGAAAVLLARCMVVRDFRDHITLARPAAPGGMYAS